MTALRKKDARENMLKSQILTGHVLAPAILAALLDTPREPFVPDSLRGAAYVDEELPLGGGRFLMEPLTFARLLEHAKIAPNETVLDVGCATGYSAIVLAKLAQKVVALEENVALATRARTLLASVPNIEFVQGALASGVSKTAPYDVIIIEGAIELLPQALGDQLAEGGRLLAVEHDAKAKVAASGLGTLTEWRKVRGTLYKTVLADASVALLPSFARPPSFTF